jgi:hypothetical protein
MKYTYIPTGIKGEMVRSGVDCHWKGNNNNFDLGSSFKFVY